MIFNLSNFIIKKNLAKDYDVSVLTKHPPWHPAFLGIAMNSTIHENYVCSDTKLLDVWEPAHIPCGIYPHLYPEKSKLYKNIIFYQPKDDFAYNAVVKYLNENNPDEVIGIINKSNIGQRWSLNWPRYEEILKKLYFEIIKNHPIEFLYMHLVIKPLKLLFELVKFIFYFINSFNINFIFIFLIFIGSLFLQFFNMIKTNIKSELIEIENRNYKYLIETILLMMFLAGSIPSIVFYAAPQSAIPDCQIVLIALVMFYLKKKFFNF